MSHVSFYRDFRGFSGGHLKVWNYFNHVLASPDHEASIRFSRRTVWDESNPWGQWRNGGTPRSRGKARADVRFVAGLDWLHLRPAARGRGRRPVLNLVQHVRHADPDDPRHRFLGHPAIRICVSEEVASAVTATGRVKGPIFTIPNAVDVRMGAVDNGAATCRDIDVLVVANKRPDLGRRLRDRLCGGDERVVHLVDRTLPRPAFLDLLRRARVSVFAPGRTEGFYLPALEGMALGTLVVCADCVGNRSFCLPGENCYRPEATEEALVAAVEQACALPQDAVGTMVARGRATAAQHDLSSERAAFLDILDNVDELWASIRPTHR